uniref:Uncharacterized protein n=1 Tax=Fundulus heteroclitus TaxID=8078 RepID=A0A3Q2PYP0_FUNHE
MKSLAFTSANRPSITGHLSSISFVTRWKFPKHTHNCRLQQTSLHHLSSESHIFLHKGSLTK